MPCPLHAPWVLQLALGAVAVAGQTTAPAAPPKPLLGVAINAHHISDLSLYLEGVDAIAGLGANALVLVTPMFQRHVDSSEIRFVPDRCPTDEQLIAILRRARAQGLYTTLLPIVLIEHPGEKDWRGLIRPEDPERWWASYDRFTERFLTIAEAADVDAYSVGSELNTMEPRLDRWERLLGRVRARFPGHVTYTSNWDRYDRVTLWPLVDFISVSAYFELARHDPEASVGKLTRAWSRRREELLGVARRWDRPLVLMEIGYPSLPSAAAHPWDYVAEAGTRADHEAQARCYQAFFGAWADEVAREESRTLGFHCYAWDPYRRGEDDDTGYGIRGKPAMEIIRHGFQAIRRSAGR